MNQVLYSPAQTLASVQVGALAVDCRFDAVGSGSADRGSRDYADAHVPGAVYAHLERDLSDLHVHGRGRHPLPSAEDFSDSLSRWGVTAATQVIAYDDGNGAMAARLWWLLKLVGHERAAVMDGGWSAWRAAGLPTESTAPVRSPTSYRVSFDESAIVTSIALRRLISERAVALLDARAAPRFRGENETIDPVAGHVPGARNRPFLSNLDSGGRFKSVAQLRSEFADILQSSTPTQTVLMCGSGVTACHNLLAMEHAGLHGARIYAGSWSEWISDTSRPIATGPA